MYSLISCNIHRLESSVGHETILRKIELRSEHRLKENKIVNTFIVSITKERTHHKQILAIHVASNIHTQSTCNLHIHKKKKKKMKLMIKMERKLNKHTWNSPLKHNLMILSKNFLLWICKENSHGVFL